MKFLREADAQAYDDMTQRWEDFRSAQLYFGDPSQKLTGQALGVFGTINAMVSDLLVGIFGSDERERKRLLMHKVAACLESNDGPVIILTGDEPLHQSLLPAFTRSDQELWLTTSADPNYHLLYGLDDESICAIFRDMARREGSGSWTGSGPST